ncbi:hypothetical protein WK13_28050 [Burkholderia ubonensis]|nr:hypothetical protein WK13_28050 [Burkholderia ubonensis]
MPSHAASTIDTLQALLREREAMLVRLQETISAQQAALDARSAEIDHLKPVMAKLRRQQCGRKSEKLDHEIAQLELRLEELQADEGAASPDELTQRVMNRAPSKRAPLPPHLPREVHTYRPDGAVACTQCGGPMKWLGEDVSEQLEYVPARFKVIRHVRPKYACACCDHIEQAAAPARPIMRGLAGPGLLAHVLVAKYCMRSFNDAPQRLRAAGMLHGMRVA